MELGDESARATADQPNHGTPSLRTPAAGAVSDGVARVAFAAGAPIGDAISAPATADASLDPLGQRRDDADASDRLVGISLINYVVKLMPTGLEPKPKAKSPEGVRAIVSLELSDGRLVYDPNHPLADDNGFVRAPDMDLTDQMTSLIIAQRAYPANVTVFERARDAYLRALEERHGVRSVAFGAWVRSASLHEARTIFQAVLERTDDQRMRGRHAGDARERRPFGMQISSEQQKVADGGVRLSLASTVIRSFGQSKVSFTLGGSMSIRVGSGERTNSTSGWSGIQPNGGGVSRNGRGASGWRVRRVAVESPAMFARRRREDYLGACAS